jgi:hypothetical protein
MSTYQKINYTSKIGNNQAFHKSHQSFVYERDPFNAYQNFLYKRALFGLSVYSKEEIDAMHYSKKKRIIGVHKRAQSILNVWKQELCHAFVSNFLLKIFHHSKFVKDYVQNFADVTDPEYISKTEFKDLGISKEDIIDKLINEKVLPYNFYELKG